MELFFAHKGQITDDTIALDEFEIKHLKQVLRKGDGDIIRVTDGEGNLYHAKIISIQPDVSLKILEQRMIKRPIPSVTLAVGYIRPNRLDIILEKGCELGADKFYLLKTAYANYFSANTKRYEKILRQAVKQSLQVYLPDLQCESSLGNFLSEPSDRSLMLVAVDSKQPNILDVLNKTYIPARTEEIILFIGPEGGFSEEEVQQITAEGFLPVSLGTTRLRAETAAITGLSVIQMYVNQHKEKSFDS